MLKFRINLGSTNDPDLVKLEIIEFSDIPSLYNQYDESYLYDVLEKAQRFTGLFDKNGVEIYEGDTVRILYTDWPSQSREQNGRYSMSLDEYKKSISKLGVVKFDNAKFFMEFDKGTGSIHEGTHGEKEVIRC